MQIENIDITPDRSLILKLGNSGYSLEESIAEFIDNSIDATPQEETLIVEIDISQEGISIKDNGKGMNKREISNYLKLGASEKTNQLGKFGLGMKTACLSLGRNFIIKTSQLNSKSFTLIYNQEKWLQEGQWDKYPLMINSNQENKQGTLISISELSIEISDKKIEKLKQHLGLRFGKFIENKKMSLRINNSECSSQLPKLTSEGKKHFQITLKEGKILNGWYGYKLTETIKTRFGFHTYRNKRLITMHDKIGISSNQKSRQLIGEIELDHVPVTHNKRDWIRESNEFKEIEQTLIDFIQQNEKRLMKILEGTPASPGRVEGSAKVISSFISNQDKEKQFEEISEGDILVTEVTRPEMLFSLQKIKGLITDVGGYLSHPAIVAREFDIPTVVGTENATQVLKTGQKIILDASEGKVYVEAESI